MKIDKKTRRQSGFTLIELLVVITIVAVLAAMSFAGVNSALKKARKTEGTVAATTLAGAVEKFYSEYNRLPELPENMQTDSGPGVQLLNILLGDDSSEEENPRQVVFLEVKEAKAKKGGIAYGSGGGSAEGMYDPFGNPFSVVINTNYEDILRFSAGGKQYTLRGVNAAVYSPGADREEGTIDDITSFQR